MRLIPAIDLKSGRCVRLYQGDFEAETRYPVEPLDLARRYRDLGADWLHIVDLDGAKDGVGGNVSIIEGLAGLPGLKLQVGGGLRDAASIRRMIDAGVSRVVIGSAAVTHPHDVADWFDAFGSQRITLAFDIRLSEQAVPCLATHGWRTQSQLSLWHAVDRYAPDGLTHVLCTDVSRDGALNGPNLELYQEALGKYPAVEWQASGGIRDAADLQALADIGVKAAISGKALLEGRIPIEELQAFLPNA
jgi:phosphoribosylformimino-5-aminoimidazole carboxamide ribotide isomerase